MPARVAAAREDVERVEADAEGGVIGRLDDPPRVLVVVHVAAPGERLVGDPQAARRRRARPARAAGRPRASSSSIASGADARADEHRVGAERLHDVELRLRAAQVAIEHRRRHGLEVAKRLVERDLQAERLARAAHLGRGQRRADQVRLEQLDRVEAGRRRRPRASPPACRSGRRWRCPCPRRPLARQLVEVREHAVRGRLEPGEQLERVHGLEDAPCAPPSSVRQPRSRAACEQLRRQRQVDDLGDPQARVEQLGVERPCRGGRPCPSASRGSARRLARARRGGRRPARRRAGPGPRRAPRPAPVVLVDDVQSPGPERQHRVARPPRPPRRRPSSTTSLEARARQAARESPRRSPASRCCGRPCGRRRSTTVLTAPSASASRRELVEMRRRPAACTGG